MRSMMPVVALMVSACIPNSATRDRGAAGLFENVPLERAPQVDRCSAHSGSMAKPCADATYLGQIYARKLSTGDSVCLQGGFGDPPGASCLARALVADVAENRVLLEVRDAKPDSKYFQKESHQIWFEEGALVDLYLQEHGY